MRKVLVAVVTGLLIAGCGSQAQPAQEPPGGDDRLRAIEAQQQTILKEIEAVQTNQRQLEDKLKDMERKIRNLEANQRSLKMEQENLRSEIRSLSLRGSNFDLPDFGGTAPVQAAKCEDPYTILQKKLEKIEGTPTNTGFAALVDMALAEYEACLRGNR